MSIVTWSTLDQPPLVTDIVYKTHPDLILQWTRCHLWKAPLSLSHRKDHLTQLKSQGYEEIKIGGFLLILWPSEFPEYAGESSSLTVQDWSVKVKWRTWAHVLYKAIGKRR